MIITIKNFANIRDLSIDFDNNKLNFVYGISGSGKTSIAKALTTPKDQIEQFKTFGCNGNVVVDLGENINFKIFNDQAVQEYIFAKSGDGIYDVIYGENPELIKLKGKLNDLLNNQEIVDIKNIIKNQTFVIDQLEKELGLKRTSSGAPSKTGIFKSLGNPTKYYDINDDLDMKHKTWIKNGKEFFDSCNCPFCNQKMVSEVVDRVTKIINELPEDYSKVVQSEKLLKSLSINVDVSKINEREVQDKLFKQISHHYKMLSEMQKIEEALNISIDSDVGLDKKINIKKPSDEIIKIFKDSGIDIVNVINELIKESEGYSLLKKMYNGKLQTSIKGNIRKINENISFFGIHYKLVKSDLLSRNDGYSLIHNNASNDTSNFLSTGEKNIVALILFLTSYSESHIIVDDPASSFDEYRREQILSFIYKIRYKESTHRMTTIILSHDQIFLKFLTKNYIENEAYKDSIGSVYHFENIGGQSSVNQILSEDMQPISTHILRKLKSVKDYSQKIVNLRLYYEVTDLDSIEYSYLSAILHSSTHNLTQKDLYKMLADNDISEHEILKNIQTTTRVDLKIFEENTIKFDFDKLCYFEKMCCIRELLEDGTPDKKILNDVIHFNYALNYLLNPYEFNFQNEKSYLIINQY